MTEPLHTHTVTPSMSWQGPQGECPWCRAGQTASEGPTMTDTVKIAGALLPCPFCGGRPVAQPDSRQFDEHGCFEAFECANENCPGKPVTDSLSYPLAIAAWNTRAAHPTPAPPSDAKGT